MTENLANSTMATSGGSDRKVQNGSIEKNSQWRKSHKGKIWYVIERIEQKKYMKLEFEVVTKFNS